MKIIIIESDTKIKATIESILVKGNTAHELFFFNELSAGKSLLAQANIDLVILDLEIIQMAEVKKQLKSISKSLILTKALFLVSDTHLAKEPDFEIIHSFFKDADFKLNEEVNILFLPIRIDLLKNLPEVPCDIYVKISDIKFVKIIKKGQVDSVVDTVNKYVTKGIEFLYVEKHLYASLSHLLMHDLFAAEQSLPVAERGIKITESIISVTKDLGASEAVLESINESYAHVIKNLEYEKVTSLLANLSTDENIFIENHSYLTSVFAVMLSRKMEWSTPTIQNNLCMAALLHDLVLADHQLGHHDRDDLETIKNLPYKTRDIVLNHPKILADKLSKTTKLPTDVITLIAKHHDGRGANSYPGVDTIAIMPPVQCLFNVAHQFSIELYKIGFNNKKLPIAFDNLRKIFKHNKMRQYIDLLEAEVNL